MGQFLTKSSKILCYCSLSSLEKFEGERLISIPKYGYKNICDRMFSKHLIETISKMFLSDGYENQLLLNICETFSEHLQNIVNKCCLNILCILFIRHFMINV